MKRRLWLRGRGQVYVDVSDCCGGTLQRDDDEIVLAPHASDRPAVLRMRFEAELGQDICMRGAQACFELIGGRDRENDGRGSQLWGHRLYNSGAAGLLGLPQERGGQFYEGQVLVLH